MDSDPIGQLQALLDQRASLLESITAGHSALGSIRKNRFQFTADDPTSAQRLAPTTAAVDDPIYGRLLRTAHDMQVQIEERLRPVVNELLQSQVATLRGQSERGQSALKDCLSQIDDSVANCFARMDQYQRLRAELTALNQRLADFGATPEPFAPTLETNDVVAGIMSGLKGLRAEGKI